MKKIGITGGIGSGKSTVAAFFDKILHVPVYYADERAKALYTEDAKLALSLRELFGDDIYDDAGHFLRQNLAARVFGSPESLQQLNALVHPAVERDFLNWCEKHSDKNYIIKEAALIFESGTRKQLDMVYTVTAPEAIRMERAAKRDGVSRERILERMSAQWSDARRLEHSDGAIVNDGAQMLIPQILALHMKFSVKSE